MWRSVLLFLPTALAFIAILVVGYVVARLLRTLVGKGLGRTGFDRAVERGTVGRVLRNGKVSASDLCAKIVFYAVLLFALQFAFGIWGPNPVSDVLTALISWLPRAFVAIVIVVVAAAIAGAAYDLIVSALGGLAYGKVLGRAVAIVIVTLGVIAALDQVRIATSVTQPLLIAVLATVAGVVIVGVGGGLIRPMQSRWETWLDRASTESEAIREHAKAYADERRRAEEARVADEARRAEEARLAEEARVAEARRVEEARAAEEARVAEARRVREAEEARLAKEAKEAEEARQAAVAKRAEEARQAAVAQAEAERQAAAARAADQQLMAEAKAEAARRAAATASPPDDTQVIPAPRGRRVTDAAFDLEPPENRADFIPGFASDTDTDAVDPDPELDLDLDGGDPDATTVISSDTADTTIINPGPDATVVIGPDETQVIPSADDTTQDVAADDTASRRKPGT
jgi:hypothetical protein